MRTLSEFGKEALQRCLLRGTFVWRLADDPHCALTFDDGPHEIYTPKILDLLARHGIKATFFVVGQSAVRFPELVSRIACEGHCVASHTYTHRDLPTLSGAELRQELEYCRRLIMELTGVDTNLFRPPRGRLDVSSLLRIRKWGYQVVHWTKTYSDYIQDSPGELLGRIRRIGLKTGDIALFHDHNANTIEALHEVIPEWRARGHTFRTIGNGAVACK